MPLYEKLQQHLSDYTVELLSLENLDKYEKVFYCNNDYYLITDGRNVSKDDCIDTIEYCPHDFPKEKCYCVGFSFNGEAAAVLSLLEGYPEYGVLYIGLFLMNEKFKQKGIATKIINTLIDEAFRTEYKTIKLSVQDNNISGFSFWKKIGFSITEIYGCNGFSNLSMEYSHN